MELRIDLGGVGQRLRYLFPQKGREMLAETKDHRLDSPDAQSEFVRDPSIGVHIFEVSLYQIELEPVESLGFALNDIFVAQPTCHA